MEYQEFSGATVEEAITEATISLETPSDNIEYEIIEEGRSGIIGIFNKKAVIRARKKEISAGGDQLIEFVKGVLLMMNIPAELEIETDHEEKQINIDIKGEDTDCLIDKKGQALDALQNLAGIVANKNKGNYYRVRLDTKNYRERRQKTLENLAKNVASKVKKTKRKVVLEPMNPYERRIFHSYLQDDKFVITKSEGEDPNRRIVVFYKRSEK